MSKIKVCQFACALVLLSISVTAVLAEVVVTPVVITNPSFEEPALADGVFTTVYPGWTGGGVFNPTVETPTDGDQFLYINTGSAFSTSLGTLEADTLYILEADFGQRQGGTDNVFHGMHLLGGGTRLGYVNNSNLFNGPTPPDGGFAPAIGYFTADRNVAPGANLQIEFARGGTEQANFDNVRLTKITGAAIPIANHSFEGTDVGSNNGFAMAAAGWTVSGNAGTFEGATQITPTDGVQAAYITGGASLSQTLTGTTFTPGRYILMADVGDRLATTTAGYQMELLVDGVQVAIDDNSVGVLQQTTTSGIMYTPSVIDFTADANDATLAGLFGGELGIRLTALGIGSNQTYFDNIRLFALPAAAVPEPGSMVTWGLVMLGAVGIRRLRRRGGSRC